MTSEQNPLTQSTRTVIDRFNEAFNRHDVDALAPLLTDDTVFEDTSPAPDGRRMVAGVVCAECGRSLRGGGHVCER